MPNAANAIAELAVSCMTSLPYDGLKLDLVHLTSAEIHGPRIVLHDLQPLPE